MGNLGLKRIPERSTAGSKGGKAAAVGMTVDEWKEGK